VFELDFGEIDETMLDSSCLVLLRRLSALEGTHTLTYFMADAFSFLFCFLFFIFIIPSSMTKKKYAEMVR
jgi:hypothetical protein